MEKVAHVIRHCRGDNLWWIKVEGGKGLKDSQFQTKEEEEVLVRARLCKQER